MVDLHDNTPRQIREDILRCIIENQIITDNSGRPDVKKYEELLRTQFTLVNADYDNPDYTSLLKVMKLLASRELRSGKSSKEIGKNFLSIANRIKNVCGVC